jgi:hypothetical protein
MPEQASKRDLAVTASEFRGPFQTEIWPFGRGGLNLQDQKDAIPVGQWAVHTNLVYQTDQGVSPRPGLTALATAGTAHHSVRRLNDPQNATYTRVWGIDQALYIGQSGALTNIDAGYSGDPLCLIPHRPPLSGDPWMFVADRSRMRKVRADGVDLPIGLPAPAVAPSVALGTRRLKTIANFDLGSDTDPAVWTKNKGFTYDDPPVATDLPEILAITAPDADDTAAIHFGRIASAARPNGDYVYFGVPITRDLSTFGGGVDITDDDYIHLWLNFSHPLLIEEFRIYIVVAASFSPTVLPGIPDGLGSNTDAYIKSFSQADFAAFFAAQADQVSDAEAARVRAVRDTSLATQATTQGTRTDNLGRLRYVRKIPTASTTLATAAAITDPFRAITDQGPAGADQWHELGVLGVPVRRGDFQRMGETANRNWSTVTGLVCLIKTGPNSGPGPVAVRLGNFYLTGGSAPDTGEPGAQPYDYRTTDYDPRTGAESNPGPEQTDATKIDTLRRAIVVTPPAATDGALRQRVYRRGGFNNEDWNFLGVNAANGGAYTDTASDDTAAGAGTLEIDHYQPVPTVDDTGATILAQPVHTIFGPANGLIFGLGDPYRPGHLYWCTPDQPDHWPATNNYEVCAPSEELMAGLMYGAQPFCFSRSRLFAIYPNLSGDTAVSVSTTACKRGIVSRTAWAIGLGGIYGVCPDGIFNTSGGAEDLGLSEDILPLFRGQSVSGYDPIDFTFPNVIRLAIAQDLLYFQYQDTSGNRRVLVYSLLFKYWTAYAFAPDLAYILPDDDSPQATVLCGGRVTGTSYTHTGFSDAGAPIVWTARTGTWNLGRPREDKLLGDQILDADLQGSTVTLQNRLNDESVVNTLQAIDVATGRQRFIFDSFGNVPQRARNISAEFSGSSSTVRPTLYFLGQSVIPEPDVTMNRVTQWDDLGHPDESYVTGITLECDTGAIARSIIFERDFAGVVSTIATKSVLTDGRHKIKFTWDALPCHMVRVHPNDDCKGWILYEANWLSVPEPPRIAGWDIHFETEGDRYYTGLDLYCDTGGLEKQIEVSIDGTILTNPYTSEAFWRITAAGRRFLHLTFLAGRGHVFHFRALDANPGLLYKHVWHAIDEPSEQANFDAAYSIHGTLADKYFKAFLFEVDTFGVSKTITVDLDGTVVETFSLQTTGRQVVHHALSQQRLGRVLRVYPTDGNPGRPYTILPIFDVEPYKLTRWNTQVTDHGLPDFHLVLDAQVTLKSTADVTLTIAAYINQTGTIVTDTYTIPSTGGVKLKRFLREFQPRKGVLYQYVFESADDFFLYEEESHVRIQPWRGGDIVLVHPFGTDDVDPVRNFVTPSLAAARSGGGGGT